MNFSDPLIITILLLQFSIDKGFAPCHAGSRIPGFYPEGMVPFIPIVFLILMGYQDVLASQPV